MSIFGLTQLPELFNGSNEISECPFEITHPIMIHEWTDLTFIHWKYRPEEVQRLLPSGLTVEIIDGSAWVSLVPFRMRVDIPKIGPVPYFSRFPETNVRTYVTAEDGSHGIWFFSLDASRLSAVLTARVGYRLPYFWSKMRVSKTGSTITYSSKRRFPGPIGAKLDTKIQIDEEYKPEELSDRDHLLSARWKLFSREFGSIYEAYADHEPWVLHKANAVAIDDHLLKAAGLSDPKEKPIVQYSPGVRVKISMPRKVVVDEPLIAEDERKIILFDGVCNLCNGFVQHVIRHDKNNQFSFAPLQSEFAQKLLSEFSQSTIGLDTVIYIKGKRCFNRSSATLYIAKDLGGWRSMVAIFLLIPAPIRNIFYRIVAKYRYKIFGKRESCMVPTPELKNKFLG